MSEKEDMRKRLDNLQEDMWSMDLLAGELIEEKGDIAKELAPLVASAKNIEYKLLDLTQRKTQALVQYRMGFKILKNLEDAKEGMEVV